MMPNRGQTSLKAVNKAGPQPTKQVKRTLTLVMTVVSMHGVQTQLDLMSQTLTDRRENLQHTLKLVKPTVNKIVESLEKHETDNRNKN